MKQNTILIIEDSTVAMAHLKRILSPEYEIYTAVNGQKGLQMAHKYTPDLILCDIVMPDIDGYEVIKILKTAAKTKMIPIIFITALDEITHEEKGLALGAEDYIRKPFEDTIVMLRVKTQIRILNYIRTIEQFAEKERLQKELEEALHRANEASRAKTDFLAKMSHEIRTPMNAIIGMSELALRGDKTDNIKEYVFTIKQAGSDLLAIINDILDFSKIEAGKMEIIPGNFEVASLLNDLVSIIRMRLVDSKIRFAVKVDRNIPGILFGDETRIRQAVLNILNNAVKYTDIGFISFAVYGEFIDAHTLNVTFEVMDTGKGIKEEDIEGLFAEFSQFDLERNRRIEGVGLGLAITHNIVHAMGGTIEVRSEYGKGSTFTITLPLRFDSRDALAEVEHPVDKNVLIYERREIYSDSLIYTVENLGVDTTLVTSGVELYEQMKDREFDFLFISFELLQKNKDTVANFGKNTKVIILTEFGEAVPDKNANILSMPVYCTYIANILNGSQGKFSYAAGNESLISFTAPEARVLIVDDIMTNLRVAQGLLAPYKMRVDLCNGGLAAIETIREERYDLIFMDHRMPGVDGVEVTRRVRDFGEDDPYYKDVPIVALTANAVSGMMEMFMENGFSDFLSKPIDTVKLNAILDKWIPGEKKESTGRIIGFTRKPDGEVIPVTIEGINVPKGLANTGGRLEDYVEALSAFYTDVSENIEAIESCVGSDDLSLYTTYVHGIKGAAATIGSDEIYEAAKELEAAGRREDRVYISENHRDFVIDLKTTIKNIKGALDSTQEISAYNAKSITAELAALKIALEQLDAASVHEFVGELLKSTRGHMVYETVRKIADCILIGDHDSALEMISYLIREGNL